MVWPGLGERGIRLQDPELGAKGEQRTGFRVKEKNKTKQTHLKASPVVKGLRKCNPGRRPPEGKQSPVVREGRKFMSREEMRTV